MLLLAVAAFVIAADVISKAIVVATMPGHPNIRLLGGATGNLLDRIFRAPGLFQGHVVDWIELPDWPVFNLADSAIVCAGVLVVLLALLGIRMDGTRPAREPA